MSHFIFIFCSKMYICEIMKISLIFINVSMWIVWVTSVTYCGHTSKCDLARSGLTCIIYCITRKVSRKRFSYTYSITFLFNEQMNCQRITFLYLPPPPFPPPAKSTPSFPYPPKNTNWFNIKTLIQMK